MRIALPRALYHDNVSGISARPSASEVAAPSFGLECSGQGSKPTMRFSEKAQFWYCTTAEPMHISGNYTIHLLIERLSMDGH